MILGQSPTFKSTVFYIVINILFCLSLKKSIQYLPVVILDTVGVVVVISDERRPLQYTGTGAAAETVSMETLANCLQHTIRDLLPTSGTHSQGILRGRINKRCNREGDTFSQSVSANNRQKDFKIQTLTFRIKNEKKY